MMNDKKSRTELDARGGMPDGDPLGKIFCTVWRATGRGKTLLGLEPNDTNHQDTSFYFHFEIQETIFVLVPMATWSAAYV